MLKYHFKIHNAEEGGYWAECVEIEGCRTQGDSKEELMKNMKEVLNLCLDEPAESKDILSMPNNKIKGQDIVEVEANINIVFAMLLRQERLKNNMTQKEVAEKLGYKSDYAYRKLEDSRYANPSIKTIQKLRKVLPGLPLF